MTRIAMLMTAGVCLLAAPAMGQQPQRQAELPVTTVVLFSSGVGYFEHAGPIDGDAEVALMFQREQINDVLKSMVTMDASGKGQVRRVSYGSREPVGRALKSFAVDISGDPTLEQLLGQLRGAQVRVNAGKPIEGTVLNVQSRERVVGDPPAKVVQWRLNLVTDAGIRTLNVDEIQSLELADPKLAGELRKALAMLSAARDKDRSPVTVEFAGQGKRDVRLGYIVEAPVWKVSYRLDLTGDKPLLQGWAIVENASESDWERVRLTLVSGQPISFIQDLYTPLYVPRPVVVPENHANLQPRIYDEGIADLGDLKSLEARRKYYQQIRRTERSLGDDDGLFGDDDDDYATLSRQQRAAGSSRYGGQITGGVTVGGAVTAAATAGKVGELFHFTITDPVTLARRRSAMLPVVNATVNVEKVSIYNVAVMADRPLNGVRLTNDTGMKMLAGPVTVFADGAYAGDARLDHLAAGDKRLLSYAVDLEMTVNSTEADEHTRASVKVVKGVLEETRKHVRTREYVIQNKAEVDRVLIVEHPKSAGYKLVTPKEPEETTDTHYRFRVPVKAGEAGKFAVVEQRVDTRSLSILASPTGSFLAFTTDADVPADVRAALAKAARLKDELSTLQAQERASVARQTQIKDGQTRLRQNLATVGVDTELGKRYLAKLNSEETEIERLDGVIAELRKQVAAKQQELADYLTGLTVE